MKHLRLLGIIGMFTIVLTAACGGTADEQDSSGGDEAPATQAAPAKGTGGLSLDAVRDDPCQMVTKAEAEAVLGAPIQPPSELPATGTLEAGCFYSVETANLRGAAFDAAPTGSVSLMFSPERAKGGMNGKKYMDNARKGVTTQPVAEVGDEAFCAQDDPSSPPQMIFARVGDIVLSAVSKDCTMAAQFAVKALARL